MRGACCCSPRPIRPAISRSCGARRSGSESPSRPPTRPRSDGPARRSAQVWCSVIRWRVRLCTGQPRRRRAERGPSRPGGRDRSGRRSRSPRLAPGAGDVDARRGRRRRARAFGGASAGTRRIRRGRRVPRALVRARRPNRLVGRPRPRRGPGEPRRRARSTRRSDSSATRRRDRWTAFQRARWTCFARASPSLPNRNEAPPLLLAPPRTRAVGWTLAREIYLDALSAAVFAGRLAGPVASSRRSPPARAADATRPGAGSLLDGLALDDHRRARRPERRPCERRCVRSTNDDTGTDEVSAGGGGWPAGPPASSGTTRRWDSLTMRQIEPPVRPAHSPSSRSPSRLGSACALFGGDVAGGRVARRGSRTRSPRRPTVASSRRTAS